MKKEKILKIVNGIITIAIGVFIILSFLYTGSPITDNAKILNVIIIGIAICYLFFQKLFGKKVTIIENKFDIFVFILCIATFIPILFGKQVSTSEAFLYVLKYMAVFASYLLGKQIAKENPKYITILVYMTLASGVMTFVLGIDDISTRHFKDFLVNKIGNVDIYYTEQRVMGTFGYPNAFAADMAFCFFLSLGRYLASDKKWKKGILAIFTYVFFTGVLLTYSKAMFVVLPMVLLVFLLVLRKKEDTIPTICLLAILAIFAIIYASIYGRLLTQKEYRTLWLITVAIPFLVGIVVSIFQGMIEKIARWKTRSLICIAMVIVISMGAFLGIGLTLKKPLVLFDRIGSAYELKQVLVDLKPNTEYEFTFAIDAKAANESNTAYQIELLQENKYYDTIEVTTENFGTFSGNKTIKIKTKEDFVELSMTFKNKEVQNSESFVVNGVWINGKERIIEYRYLPQTLVSKLENINFRNKSTWERFVYMQTALRMIAKEPLLGIGGGGWEYRYHEMQPYLYYARQTHCYPLQLWLEFGIVSIIAYLGMVISFLMLLKKEVRKEENQKEIDRKSKIRYLSLLMAILVILVHSIFDFEMSFTSILYLVFLFMGMVNGIKQKEKKEEKEEITQEKEKRKYITIFLQTLIILYLLAGFILNLGDYLATENELRLDNVLQEYKRDHHLLEENIQKAPYNREARINKIEYLITYKALKKQDSVLLQEEKEEVTNEILKEYEWLMKNEPNSYIRTEYSEYLYQIEEESKVDLQVYHLNLIYQKLKEEWKMEPLDMQSIWGNYHLSTEAGKLSEKLYGYTGEKQLKEIALQFYDLAHENYEEDMKNLQDKEKIRKKEEESKLILDLIAKQKEEAIIKQQQLQKE